MGFARVAYRFQLDIRMFHAIVLAEALAISLRYIDVRVYSTLLRDYLD